MQGNILKHIKVYCDREPFIGEQKKYRTVFRREEAENMHVDITLNNILYMSGNWDANVMLILYASGSNENSLGVEYSKAAVSETDHECKLTACFSNLSLDPGDYAITAAFYESVSPDATVEKDTIGTVGFHVVDLPEEGVNCFSLENFSLYRRENDYEDISLNSPQSSFVLNGLVYIELNFSARNKLSFQWPAEFIVSLFDNTGMLKERHVQHDLFPASNEDYFHFIVLFGIGGQSYWRKGDYRVEVIFMNELIIVAPFTVGDKDLEACFDPLSIMPQSQHSGKKTVKASMLTIDPLTHIRNMIGLRELKEKLNRQIDRVNYDKIRHEAGIKTKPISLHSAFLGNPGTGKTTVATLMGKVFHELGLLSQGHVVFKERNTLTGTLWGSEEQKTREAIARAKGGVLFIDEAYTLARIDDPKDPGLRIIETLLTTLSDESNRDIMIILSGYPDLMTQMLNKNPGMRSRIPNIYHFDDYNPDELMLIAESYLSTNAFDIADDAKSALRREVERAYNQRDEKFGNGRYIVSLLENEVIQNLATRLMAKGAFDVERISLIEKCDVPLLQPALQGDTMAGLEAMVGLATLKRSIYDHLNYVRFAKLRNDMGKTTAIPPLHMVFTGNPGTGKTTVADFISEIYRSLGILSRGHLVQVTRSDLVDNIIGGTENNTKKAIEAAMGGVLFIDEAYSLLGEGKDFGRHVIETLLTTLSREQIDLVVIMAGYPDEMDSLLASNTGLKSRFPYTFHFEDYSPDELMQIADQTVTKNGYAFSPAAREALNVLVNKEHKQRDSHFGNARFVTRLITTQIIPRMSSRVIGLAEARIQADPSLVEIIEMEDIPVEANAVELCNGRDFDEKTIAELLEQLDAMVGLSKVKAAIHKFVNIARFLNSQGKSVMSGKPMKWSFTGNTGTGKSSVAELFAGLLKAINLLGKGHLVEINAEELYCVPSYKADEILKRNMILSQQGLLFIDGDAPVFKNEDNRFDSEQLRIRLSGYASALHGPYALVIAEREAPRRQTASDDLASLDHIFVFDDYTEQELLMILQQMLTRENFAMDEQATQTMTRYIAGLYSTKHLGYANARTMNILANTITGNAYLRISQSAAPDDNNRIIQTDVATFVWNEQTPFYRQRKKVGFVKN